MQFRILFTEEALNSCKALIVMNPAKLKKVYKALEFLQANPRHPSLNTHEYSSLKGPDEQKVFEAYVENKTPAAFRIFWYYGPNKDEITVITITAHP